MTRLKTGLTFAFGELLEDIGAWLSAGIIIAGAISFIIPDGFIERYLGGGFLPLVVMLFAGMPVFVCATSSTPIVAALALKGLSPGAALVFLLAGPVTNAATITVLVGLLGKRITAVYVAVISVMSLLLGVCTNAVYNVLNLDITGWVRYGGQERISLFAVTCAVILSALIIKNLIPKTIRKNHLTKCSTNR